MIVFLSQTFLLIDEAYLVSITVSYGRAILNRPRSIQKFSRIALYRNKNISKATEGKAK